jgi:hypothetical protein
MENTILQLGKCILYHCNSNFQCSTKMEKKEKEHMHELYAPTTNYMVQTTTPYKQITITKSSL